MPSEKETPNPKLISPSKTRIGWIGIGIMGLAMVSHIPDAGYSVTVYARDLRKSKILQTKGAHTANSLKELAEMSDIVFTIIGNANDVRSLLLGPDGVLSGLKPNGVTVDMTSSQPALARELNKQLSKHLFSGMVANGDGKLEFQGVISVTSRLNGISRFLLATCLRFGQ